MQSCCGGPACGLPSADGPWALACSMPWYSPCYPLSQRDPHRVHSTPEDSSTARHVLQGCRNSVRVLSAFPATPGQVAASPRRRQQVLAYVRRCAACASTIARYRSTKEEQLWQRLLQPYL